MTAEMNESFVEAKKIVMTRTTKKFSYSMNFRLFKDPVSRRTPLLQLGERSQEKEKREESVNFLKARRMLYHKTKVEDEY